MSDVAWVKLPEDTKEVCWRTSFGWSKAGPNCGKKASWGKHDGMAIIFCEDCYNAWMADRKRNEEWAKRNLVTSVLPGGTIVARRRDDVKEN